jgi:hypothetical protein
MKAREPFILQDRVLLAALLFGSSGYIVVGSWAGIAMLVAGYILAAVWSFHTAQSNRNLRLRLLATLLLLMLGAYLTVYVAANQGVLH